jgi:hypothetical protein
LTWWFYIKTNLFLLPCHQPSTEINDVFLFSDVYHFIKGFSLLNLAHLSHILFA